MSIPSNGWMPQAPQKSPDFDPPPANAYGEHSQIAPKEAGGFKNFLFGEDGADIYDVLDVVNPLQHIPFIGTVYRELIGDQIGYGARIAGGALYGGVVGLAATAVNAAVDAVTGRDVGEHAMAAYRGKEAKPADTPLMAEFFRSDSETKLQSQQAEVPAIQAVAQQETASILPVAGAPPPADGMSHFAAFRPNAKPASNAKPIPAAQIPSPPPLKQAADFAIKADRLLSPAELAAKLNRQQAAERQAVINRANTLEVESTPKPKAASGPAFPAKNGQKPSLSGNWFDSAMMDTLVKYQAMKQDRQPL